MTSPANDLFMKWKWYMAEKGEMLVIMAVTLFGEQSYI